MNKPSFPRLLLLSASLLLASCGNGESTPSSSLIPSSEESVSSTASLEEPSSSDSPSSTEESIPSSEESSVEESSVEESSVEESSSEPLAPATPIAEFRSSVETGAKVDLEGIVVAHR